MKQGTGVSASLVAILSSVATISCCLPLGFAAALGAGAASAFFTTLRPWLLGLSVVLLGLGFWQQHRANQCSIRGRLIGNVLLWTALVVVVGMILFPQEIAAFIARPCGRDSNGWVLKSVHIPAWPSVYFRQPANGLKNAASDLPVDRTCTPEWSKT
jgi:hypothetical protein